MIALLFKDVCSARYYLRRPTFCDNATQNWCNVRQLVPQTAAELPVPLASFSRGRPSLPWTAGMSSVRRREVVHRACRWPSPTTWHCALPVKTNRSTGTYWWSASIQCNTSGLKRVSDSYFISYISLFCFNGQPGIGIGGGGVHRVRVDSSADTVPIYFFLTYRIPTTNLCPWQEKKV